MYKGTLPVMVVVMAVLSTGCPGGGGGGSAVDDVADPTLVSQILDRAREAVGLGTREAVSVLKPPVGNRAQVESALSGTICAALLTPDAGTPPGALERRYLLSTGQTQTQVEAAGKAPSGALNAWAAGSASRVDAVTSLAAGDPAAAEKAFVALGCEGLLGRAFRD